MKRIKTVTIGFVALIGCGDSQKQTIPSDTATGTPDSGVLSETDDTETITDTGSASIETDTTPPPGTLGERCWVQGQPIGNPQWGVTDCAEPYTCFGNRDEAFCTQTCPATGQITDEPAIDGWCCGESGRTCSPARYWMSDTFASNCAPREIPLGQPCETTGETRCAPLCDGDAETFRITCAATDLTHGFCTHSCTAHADCLGDIPFENGCCGNTMGATYCLPDVSEACLPFS